MSALSVRNASPWLHGRRRLACSAGQTLPLLVLFMTGLLGVSGLVIDMGNLYEQHQQTQRIADAAALAGAGNIPSGAWASAAQANAATNEQPGDQVAVSFNGSDSVTVTVTRKATTSFANLFGISSATVVSSATATIAALGQVQGHIAPYAVLRTVYANGTGTVLFNQNAPGTYGTIDLPATDNTTGGSCSGDVIKGTPGNIQSVLGDTTDVGQVTLGGCLSVKSGASQPSANVINTLPGSLSTDLQPTGNGDYQLISQPWDDHNSLPPRLLYVPIVDGLPGGNGSTTVTGFSWFYATSASSGGSGLTITGVYTTIELPVTGSTVAYTPGAQGQIVTVTLTK
jgi:Flp pilus assembly protein TadG